MTALPSTTNAPNSAMKKLSKAAGFKGEGKWGSGREGRERRGGEGGKGRGGRDEKGRGEEERGGRRGKKLVFGIDERSGLFLI